MADPGRQPRPFHLLIYSDAGELGGAEMVLGRLLAALPPEIRTTLVAVDPDVLAWLGERRPGAATVHVPGVRDRTDLAGMRRHRRLFRELRPDLVQFNLSSASSCQWAILAAATIPRLRIVALEHSPMGSWSRLSSALKRLTARRLAAHVAVGERAARLIEGSTGLRPGSIRVLHHGIDPDSIDRARAVPRPEAPTVLTVSRHDPVKGLDVLIDAMALVPPQVHAVIVGSGPEGPALRRQVDRLGLADRVELREPPPGRMDAAGSMWAFDTLVLPSRLEGFPVTVLEAMFAGLPVIATDVGSVREQIEPGVTGWIVPPEDPPALAAAIAEVAADLPHAREMGAAAQRVADERFTMDATVRAWLRLYDEVLSGGPSTRR